MMDDHRVPADRIRRANSATAREGGSFVLYWMTANRRLEWNFALQHAVDWANRLCRPLVILETLRVDEPWACDRFHRFVIQGMVEKRRRLTGSSVSYLPHVEAEAGASGDLLSTLAAHASVVVVDERPAFFSPDLHSPNLAGIESPLEAVDSVGLLPLGATDRSYPSAYSFRRFLQKTLHAHLDRFPLPEPLADLDLPALGTTFVSELVAEAEAAAFDDFESAGALTTLPIDHGVSALPVAGGSTGARIRLARFAQEVLPAYGEQRNQPDRDHGSLLSAYLHFGHISAHEIFATVAAEEAWSPGDLVTPPTGARQGWWGMSASSEAFVDQLVTWRELGLNMCHHREDYDDYSSLPDWAHATLDAHRGDERPHGYDAAQLEAAATHDEIWNAAQKQLVVEGRVHNYLRMLWGKKILEWSASPEEALQTMVHLNNKFALDGRDPNSYSGIFWVLGRYDRPWGPERPIFGKVRYMSSASTARKLRIKEYLRRYQPQRGEGTAA